MTDKLVWAPFPVEGLVWPGAHRSCQSNTWGVLVSRARPVSGHGPQTIRELYRTPILVPKLCSFGPPEFRSPPARGLRCTLPTPPVGEAQDLDARASELEISQWDATYLKHELLENSI